MREVKGWVGTAIALWAAAAATLHLYFAGFGWPEPLRLRALHLGLFIPLVFLVYPARAASPRDRPSVVDLALTVLALLPSVYVYANTNYLYLRSEYLTELTSTQMVLGVLFFFVVVEGVRRAVTPILSVVAILALAYMFLAHFLPGIWHYREMSTAHIIETLFLIPDRGMYGPLIGISASLVAVFMIFGTMVEASGMGRLFSNFAAAAAGRFAGGAAKVAVISSALFGSMSGSSVSNVVTTGMFTIPMMKRLGYKPSFAGGTEAAASVGGAIMPPVMGAAAFVMAEMTGIPYRTIIGAAAGGAILYYMNILLMVHFEAKRQGLVGLPADQMPGWRTIVADAHLILPLVVLVGLLFWGYSPQHSAYWAILAVLVVSWFRRHTRVTPTALFNALARAGGMIAMIALAVACAGVIVSALTTTGLVLAFSTIIEAGAGDNLAIAAALTMVACLILGMGVPTTPAYIIVSVIAAPALIGMGAGALQAHLFVLYFAVLADATPPVSVASYAAAGIAGANPLATGFQAFRLVTGGFVVAFTFIFEPAILFRDGILAGLEVMIVNGAALVLIAAGLMGYLRGPLYGWARIVLAALGVVIALVHTLPDPLRFGVAVSVGLIVAFFPRVFGPGKTPAALRQTDA
ncbi:MAG: TRAP transporter fused permease subunit [Bauldia sp.]|nr:MAG: TRAP transporter fused permease subunit [Bauldia sp.]MBZ0226946.1 TRAP transporter fused permease subunit [Bauldia sp.]